MNLHQIGLVYRKELRDTLRDRRTLMSMIVVPMLVIPGLMYGITELGMKMVRKAQTERATVMLLGETNAPQLAAHLRASTLLDIVPARSDFAKRIADKELRAAIELPAGFETALAQGARPTVRISYHEGELRSEQALRKVEAVLDTYKNGLVAARLAAQDLSIEVLQPFAPQPVNVAPAERVSGAALGGFIPYVIILLTLTGAMYPAIDVTAGEKERGTIETILASPVSRGSLAGGKFLTVLTTAMATAVLSLLSLALSARFTSGEGRELQAFAFQLSAQGVVAMLVIMVPVAVLFSGVLLAIALTAKSYKEAQSYVTPLTIVVIMPAVAAMLPGVELNTRLALVPILNVSLVSKELVAGIYDWPAIAVIFTSSCVYAGIALAVAIAAFRRESVLFRT